MVSSKNLAGVTDMDNDAKLLKKRLELKELIDISLENTLPALFLHFPSKVLQKTTRSAKPLPVWYSIVIWLLLLLLPGPFLIKLMFDEGKLFLVTSPFLIINLLPIGLLFLILAYYNVKQVLLGLYNQIIDRIESLEDLSSLQQWLNLGWSGKFIVPFVIFWTAQFSTIVTVSFSLARKEFVGFAFIILMTAGGILASFTAYYVPFMLNLPVRLGQFHYTLYENNPAHSEVVNHISKLFMNYIYGYVFVGILLQLCVIGLDLPVSVGLFGMLVSWVPVTIQFILTQRCTANIIVRSKWKTLAKIQAQIKAENNLGDPAKLEFVNKLMDYHDRIRATPNSTITFQSGLIFLNQLLLPLLGFLLANLDKILVYLHW